MATTRPKSLVRSTALALLAGVVAVSSSACSATPERGTVAKEWSLTMRELGIRPVFPPREDLQVGDVYVRRGHPAAEIGLEEEGFMPLDLWLETIATNGPVSDFYTARAAFPESNSLLASAGTGGTNIQDAVLTTVPTGTAPVWKQPDGSRLRQVAFPDFMSLSVVSGDLRAFIPAEALGIALGSKWQGDHRMTVKIPSAYSYALPAAQLLSQAENGLADSSDAGPFMGLPASVYRMLLDGQQDWAVNAAGLTDEQRAQLLGEEQLYVDVIYEVYYTNSIDIGIAATSGSASGADVDPLATAALLPPGSERDDEDAGNGSAGDGTDEPVRADAGRVAQGEDAFARAERLNESLDDRRSSPGASVRFVSATDSSIVMRRDYKHPIAIGYRAVTVAIDPQTGQISGLGASDGAAPTAGGGPVMAQVASRLAALLATAAGSPLRSRQFDVVWLQVDWDVDGELLFAISADDGLPLTQDDLDGAREAVLSGSTASLAPANGDDAASVRAQLDQLAAGDFMLVLDN